MVCLVSSIFEYNISLYQVMLKQDKIDGLVQERPNSIANVLELCLSCTNPVKPLLPGPSELSKF